jgi:uncharacterized OB-fold protein
MNVYEATSLPSLGEEFPVAQVLKGSRCTCCEKIYFPPKRVCPKCLTIDEMDDIELNKRGKLISFTTTYAAPDEFPVPYILGCIELPEGFVLFSRICCESEEGLKIGIDMELKRVTLQQERTPKGKFGRKHLTWIFEPVLKEGNAK